MRARIRISWQPTVSAGLHHQHLEIYGNSGQLYNSDLGVADSVYDAVVDENQYVNVYVYSMNSQNQGNSATISLYIPSYVAPEVTPVEAIPDAPYNLSIEIIGWE